MGLRAVDLRAAGVRAARVRATGVRAAPVWVVVGLLAIAVLSTGMAAGSTGGAAQTTTTGTMSAAAATGRSIVARETQVAGEAALRPVAQGNPPTRASVGSSGISLRSASLLLGPRYAAVTTGIVGSQAARSATPHPTATPAPAASARPKAAPAPRPVSTARAKVAPSPSATPRPKATPAATTNLAKKPAAAVPAATPRPAPIRKASPPAIVYQHRAAGSATWGQFGGAVITRLAPGTHIRVCGRLGCWEGVSSGYGPSRKGGNLVDLDAAVFRRICGPLGVGVGSVVLSWR